MIILKMFKNFFACKIVLAANHRYPGNIQRLFRLQKCRSRKSSISWKYSQSFSPANLSQPQIVDILETFKDFFACKIVLAATHDYSENVQKLFRMQNCLSRKSAISWKHSKIFPPAKLSQQQPINILKSLKDFLTAKLSQPQIIDILETFKDFFGCKNVVAANHRYPGKIQRLFRLQICLSRKSSISWKYSQTFSPANLSQPQIVDILELFKDFFACKIVLAATHHNSENVQKLFRMQNCLSRKSAISWKHSKIFPPAKLSQQQPINILKSLKDFLAAKLSQPQIIDILETFKDFFGCKNVVAANHRYPGKIQRLFRLQICLTRKSSISWKYSQTFSPANLSQPQIVDILELFKDFFACKIVLAATHHNSENVQKFFRMQNCLSRKSAISWKHSKIFPPAKLSQQQPINILKSFRDFLPAKLSQPQIIDILEKFKDFFGCKFDLAANHLYPGNIQRLFRLQKCLSRKPSVSWRNSKTFSPAKLSSPQIFDILEFFKDLFAYKTFLAATHHYSEKIQRLFRLQNCLSRKSSISWKHSKTFLAAKMSQPQIIDILEKFKDFIACKVVLAANLRYPGNFQRPFRLRNFLSSNPSLF